MRFAYFNLDMHVYVLRSEKDGKLYVGSTSNIEKRLSTHNTGKVRSTKSRKPLSLIYQENYESITVARKRELFLKTGQGRKELNLLLERWPSG